MPKVSEMIVSKFLKKDDIDDEVIVTLKGVKLEDMPGDSNEQRWVLSFRELPKGLVLNTTTIRVLEKSFGGNSDDWVGKKVALYVDENVQFKGQIVGGLRLRPLKARPAAQATTALVPPQEEEEPPPLSDDDSPM